MRSNQAFVPNGLTHVKHLNITNLVIATFKKFKKRTDRTLDPFLLRTWHVTCDIEIKSYLMNHKIWETIIGDRPIYGTVLTILTP